MFVKVKYLIGLIYKYTNKPVFRKEITVTYPKFNYNNKKEFLIDIACFHSFSGSPIFIIIGGKIMFLGTAY